MVNQDEHKISINELAKRLETNLDSVSTAWFFYSKSELYQATLTIQSAGGISPLAILLAPPALW